MTKETLLCNGRRLAVVVLSAYCIWQGFAAALPYVRPAGAFSYLACWRSAARNAPEGRLALLCDDARDISPVERSRLIAMAWERSPDLIDTVDATGDFGFADSVLSSAWHSASAGKKLEAHGFSTVSTNEYAKTWSRGANTRPAPRKRSRVPSVAREAAAIAVELVLIFAVLSFVVRWRNVAWWKFAAAFVVAALLGVVALAHPLLAPNGLGTYGGKARLFYECGAVPAGFFQSSGGSVLQPAYPPGLAFLAYLHFALSGGCADRLVQALAVFAIALVCLMMVRRSEKWADALPAVLFCLSPVAVRLAAGFYAEPFAALALLAGWGGIRRGRLIFGCLAMGLASLFRPEAGVVALLFATGACMMRRGLVRKLAAVAMSVAPAIAWFTIAKLLGFGSVSDWDFFAVPNLGHIAYAALCEAKAFVAFAVPVVALAFCVRPVCKPRLDFEMAASLVPLALLAVLVPLACAFHTSSYARWMMDSTIPRLLWYVSAVPLSVPARCFRKPPVIFTKT